MCDEGEKNQENARFTRLYHANRPGHRPWCREVVIGHLYLAGPLLLLGGSGPSDCISALCLVDWLQQSALQMHCSFTSGFSNSTSQDNYLLLSQPYLPDSAFHTKISAFSINSAHNYLPFHQGRESSQNWPRLVESIPGSIFLIFCLPCLSPL